MQLDDYMKTRRCPDCDVRKPINGGFYVSPGKLRKSGERAKETVSKRCKECQREINRAYERTKYKGTYAGKRGPEKPALKHTGPTDKVGRLFFCDLRPSVGVVV